VRMGMMQPYFFPYLGYFALIRATDRWVVFDTPQYIRRGWVNRNRVLSSGQPDWKYVRVAVSKAPQATPISRMQVADRAGIFASVVQCLDDYRCRKAPFYLETMRLLNDCLDDPPGDLPSFLVSCLHKTCHHLGLRFEPQLYSDLPMTMSVHSKPGDWALATAIHLDATEYINPPGGRDLFDVRAFNAAGIQLSFLNHRLPRYSQSQSEFVSGLSIIDVLMWNGRDSTRRMVDDYQINTIGAAAAA
jgi:hypothetical protein